MAALCQTGEVGPQDLTTETPMTTATTSTTTTQAPKECPDAWTQFEESCYWMAIDESINWVEARERCTELNSEAHLVFVKSQEENSFLYNINGNSGSMWLGGSDSHEEGNWTWNDGTPFTYKNWYNQPDGGQSENCLYAHTSYNFAWFDNGCATHLPFICEIDLA